MACNCIGTEHQARNVILNEVRIIIPGTVLRRLILHFVQDDKDSGFVPFTPSRLNLDAIALYNGQN